MPWFVSYETRQLGAIGEFSARGLSSGAEFENEALDEVRESLNKKGFETRFPVRVFQYQENDGN